jgi:hypothetical protein
MFCYNNSNHKQLSIKRDRDMGLIVTDTIFKRTVSYTPSGSYTTTVEDQTLDGEGLKIVGTSSLVSTYYILGDNSTLKNITIQTNSTMGYNAPVIQVIGDNVTIENVHIIGGYVGIHLQRGENIQIRNSSISESSHGLYCDGIASDDKLKNIFVSNSRFHNNTEDGIKAKENVESLRLDGVFCYGNGKDGLDLYGSGMHISATNCFFYDNSVNGVDIKIDTSSDYPAKYWGTPRNMKFFACTIENNAESGAKIWRINEAVEGDEIVRDVLFNGCTFRYNHYCGLTARTAVSVVDCHFELNGHSNLSDERRSFGFGMYLLGIPLSEGQVPIEGFGRIVGNTFYDDVNLYYFDVNNILFENNIIYDSFTFRDESASLIASGSLHDTNHFPSQPPWYADTIALHNQGLFKQEAYAFYRMNDRIETAILNPRYATILTATENLLLIDVTTYTDNDGTYFIEGDVIESSVPMEDETVSFDLLPGNVLRIASGDYYDIWTTYQEQLTTFLDPYWEE